jgi:hypothetical protein
MKMNLKLLVAITAIAALPFMAHAQQGNRNQPPPPAGPKPTSADVQRVVAIITADKAKTRAYCDMIALEDQISQAEQAKDGKKAEQLANQADQVAQKLGPEYNKLMDNLQQIDPGSSEGQKLAAAFEPLDKLCTPKR